MKDQTQVHPAEVMSKALDRATGLLDILGQLFDAERESFSGGNTFVAHAIATTTVLISDARSALGDLHYSCDLTLLDNPPQSSEVMEMNFAEIGSAAVAAQQAPIAAFNVPEPATMQQASMVAGEEEQIAQTYLELLRKLTAAEVFAAEQQALSVPGASPQLLPLLRSLREDLQKIHSAA